MMRITFCQFFFFFFLVLFLPFYYSVPVDADTDTTDNVVDEMDAISLNSGDYHTCVIQAVAGIEFGGPLVCWGDNFFGQATPPTDKETHFIQVSASSSSTCGVKADSTIACFGILSTSAIPSGNFFSVSITEEFGCAIKRDQSIVCWDQEHRSDVVDGKDEYNPSSSVLSPPSGEFYQISVGKNYACALKEDGTPVCWGEEKINRRYQTAVGHNTPPEGIQFRQISASRSHHVCGVSMENNHILCWGENHRGEGEDYEGHFLKVTTQDYITCGLHENRSIECWGKGFILHKSAPEKQYYEFSAGRQHLCAIDEDSEIDCWAMDPFYKSVPEGMVAA